MLRSIGVALTGFAIAVVANGCGVGYQAFEADCDDCAVALSASPVAELTGSSHDGARALMGVGYGRAEPVDSTLGGGSAFDVNMAFDVSSSLTIEFMLGSWNLPDEVPNVSDPGSKLSMMPATAMLMFARERGLSRLYLGLGGGYSLNSYRVGSAHATAMSTEHAAVTDFSVTTDDGMVLAGVLGYEMYSSADAALNLAIEARYFRSSFDKTEWANASTVFSEDSVELDVLLLRAGVTWRF